MLPHGNKLIFKFPCSFSRLASRIAFRRQVWSKLNQFSSLSCERTSADASPCGPRINASNEMTFLVSAFTIGWKAKLNSKSTPEILSGHSLACLRYCFVTGPASLRWDVCRMLTNQPVSEKINLQDYRR